MPGKKLTQLTPTTSLSDNDLLYVVDISAATNEKSKGITKSDLAALIGTTAASTSPVENEYADITALLADQGNQTTSFLQYVADASDDPNVASGEGYYEKLATSTATLADDYRLLTSTEVYVVAESNHYRIFKIQDIQDEGTPLTSVGGGKISFEYSGTDVTAVFFNKIYTDAIAEFYGKDVNISFYNRNTKKYETESITSGSWTTVNTDYYRAAVTGTNIQIADLTSADAIEFFIVEAAAGNIYTVNGSIPTTTNRLVTIPSGSTLTFNAISTQLNIADTIVTIGGSINGSTTLNDTTGEALLDYQTRVEVHANEGIRLRNFGTAYYHDITSESTGNNMASFQNSSGTIAWLSDTLQKVKISLSSAQVLALNTTPINAISAQGVGTIIVPVKITAVLTYGTVAFDNFGLKVKTSGLTVNHVLFHDSFITGTSNQIRTITCDSAGTTVDNLAINTPILITAGSDGTVGDGTIDIYITYEVITL